MLQPIWASGGAFAPGDGSKYVEENLPDFHFHARSLNAARAERRAELLAASSPQPSSVPQACRRRHGETAHSTNASKTTHTGRRLPGPAAVPNSIENNAFFNVNATRFGTIKSLFPSFNPSIMRDLSVLSSHLFKAASHKPSKVHKYSERKSPEAKTRHFSWSLLTLTSYNALNNSAEC